MEFARSDVPEGSCVVLQHEGNRPLKGASTGKEQGKGQSWKMRWPNKKSAVVWRKNELEQNNIISALCAFNKQLESLPQGVSVQFYLIQGQKLLIWSHKELNFLSRHMLEVLLHWHRMFYFCKTFQIYVRTSNRIKGIGPDAEPSEVTDICTLASMSFRACSFFALPFFLLLITIYTTLLKIQTTQSTQRICTAYTRGQCNTTVQDRKGRIPHPTKSTPNFPATC